MVNPNADCYNYSLYTNGESFVELNKIQVKVFNSNGMKWRLCTEEEKAAYKQQKEGATHEN